MMHRLALAGVILTPCHAISLRLGRDKIDLDAGGACRDSAPGEWCHAAVSWAKEIGHREHPDWFPGDASQYSEGDFQALLHQLGEVQCTRPCAEAPVSLLETADSAAADKAGAEADLSTDETFGLGQAEFMSVMENIWAPKKATAGDAPVPKQLTSRDCQEAQAGTMCYHAVSWLKRSGIAKHPTWYPTLNSSSSKKDVQALLHSLGKADCAKPCEEVRAESASKDDEVIEIVEHGRQVKSEAFELDQPSCGTTKPGEWCYQSILWLKSAGLKKHPDWYASLSEQSSIDDFQTVLHRQGKVGCPLPCKEGETPTVKFHNNECQDAQEGSVCDKGIMHIIEVGLWVHPELFPDLTKNSTREEVQDHLYRQGQSQCGWPCSLYKLGATGPKKVEELPPHAGMVKKRLQDMSVKELAWYLNKQWDGYVDASKYDPTEGVKLDHGHAAAESPEDLLPSADIEKKAEQGEARLEAAVAKIDGKNQKVCRTAKVGELCFKAVSWAKLTGVVDHPSWYVGLSATSTFKDFQAYIHETRGSLCERPCAGDEEPAAEDVAASNKEATTIEEETTSAAPGPGPTGGDIVEAGKGEEASPEETVYEDSAASSNTTSAGPLPIDPNDQVPESSNTQAASPDGDFLAEADAEHKADAEQKDFLAEADAEHKADAEQKDFLAEADAEHRADDEQKDFLAEADAENKAEAERRAVVAEPEEPLPVIKVVDGHALKEPAAEDTGVPSEPSENASAAGDQAPLSPVALPRDGVATEAEENASSQFVAPSAPKTVVVYSVPLPYVNADARLTSIEEEEAEERQMRQDVEDLQKQANSTAEEPAGEVDVTAVEVSEEEAKPTAVNQSASEEAVKIDVAMEATQEAAQAVKEDEADEARQEAAQKAEDSMEAEQAAALGSNASEEAALGASSAAVMTRVRATEEEEAEIADEEPLPVIKVVDGRALKAEDAALRSTSEEPLPVDMDSKQASLMGARSTSEGPLPVDMDSKQASLMGARSTSEGPLPVDMDSKQGDDSNGVSVKIFPPDDPAVQQAQANATNDLAAPELPDPVTSPAPEAQEPRMLGSLRTLKRWLR